MNILFVMYSLPHMRDSSMYTDIISEFKERGHNVFPVGPTSKSLSSSQLTIEDGIEVLRVKTLDISSKSSIKKGIATLFLSLQYKWALNRFWKNNKFDLVIVATPSVMFANVISYVKKKYKTKVYILQKDIFPQNAVDLGMMKKKSILYDFFRNKEIKLLKTADLIGCTSQGNVDYILKHNDFLSVEKVNVVYNCTKIIESFPKKDINILEKYNLKDKFNIVFGGNMGKPQQLDNVLKLAKHCLKHSDVMFRVIGRGTELVEFKKQIKELNLSNIEMIEYMPREDYFGVLSCCDIGLISLHQNFTVPNTPMKLNDYLNAGIPVLASIDRGNDLGQILVSNRMGEYAFADSPSDLYHKFLILYNNKNLRMEYGANANLFCNNNMSVEKSYNIIMSEINKL